MTDFDDKLFQFAATPKQVRILKALKEHRSQRGAAKALGIHHSTVQSTWNAIVGKAALRGHSPEHDMDKATPAEYVVKGTSTLYNSEGKKALQWVKTDLNKQRQLELILETIEAQAVNLPRLNPVKPPKKSDSRLCNLYTLTDCHVGMYAWEEEGGTGWDLKTAEDTLWGCFKHLIATSPSAQTGIIAQLGDFLHFDGLLQVTPKSRHVLDSSGRFTEMVEVAIRILRRMIDLALQKHEKVIVVMAEGNHDEASSVWLQIMFRTLYENEPRVEVVHSRIPYYAYQHGKVFLGWHHSHLRRMSDLPLLFAQQYPKMWGETTYRFGHTGDKHHASEKEYTGMIVTQHPTLAARDAYTSRNGWHSLRNATAYTYHEELGRVSSVTTSPEALIHA